MGGADPQGRAPGRELRLHPDGVRAAAAVAVNFAVDVVEAARPGDRALVELGQDGRRREWTFAEVARGSAGMAGALAARGVGRGDVVLTLIGNRPDWVLAMVACFRIGAVVLPCNEQLRPKDLRVRLEAAAPAVVLVGARNVPQLGAAGPTGGKAVVPDAAPREAP